MLHKIAMLLFPCTLNWLTQPDCNPQESASHIIHVCFCQMCGEEICFVDVYTEYLIADFRLREYIFSLPSFSAVCFSIVFSYNEIFLVFLSKNIFGEYSRIPNSNALSD